MFTEEKIKYGPEAEGMEEVGERKRVRVTENAREKRERGERGSQRRKS